MTIRVVRNDAGNCINFFGTSNPTYWNGCLSAAIDETYPDRINVRNDIRSAEDGTNVFEFYQIPYTEFSDADGNQFDSPADAAQYITANANVSGDTGTFIFNEVDTIDAQRAQTGETVLFSNGAIYPINTLQAIAASNGTITVRTVKGDKDIYLGIRYYNVTINNGDLSFTQLSAAVNRLNELFTGSTVGEETGVVAADAPTSSAPVTFSVYGSRITETGTGSTLGYTSTADGENFDTSNGILSVESITEAGEFFEFSQDSGDWTNTKGLTFGLFDETTYDQSDLTVDVAADAVKAILRLRINNSALLYKDPASAYGSLSEKGIQDYINTRVTFRVGLDADRRGYIAYQLANGRYEYAGRTEEPIDENTEIKFVAIFPLANELNGVRNMTVNTLIPNVPTSTWFYIESPVGSYDYPLFATAEEAEYIDEVYGTASAGAGAYHTHLYPDQVPTPTTWYMPQSYANHALTTVPVPPSGVPLNRILSGVDSGYIPVAYEDNTVTVDEGSTVNLIIKPAGDTNTYNVTGVPSTLAFDGIRLTGTAPEVADNNVTNPSDTYAITVTKANEYGSSTGTLTLVINNLTIPVNALSGFTWDSTSTTLVDLDTMGEGSVVTLDDTLEDNKRFIITETWLETNVLPNLVADGDEVIIGVAASGADWTSVEDADFDFYMSWRRNDAGQIVSNLYTGTDDELQINSLTDAVYSYGFEVNGTDVYMISGSAGDLSNQPSPGAGGTFTRTKTISSYGGTIPLTLTMATISAETTLSTDGINEIDTPSVLVLTPWTKAIDFSGSPESARQSTQDTFTNPLRMGNTAELVAAPNTPGTTVSQGHPWATAVVFKSNGFQGNAQKIWNYGGSDPDCIWVEQKANGDIFFNWGRLSTGDVNSCKIGTGFHNAPVQWHGLYVAHNGTRLSAADATAANLADAFSIRFYRNDPQSGNWAITPGGELSTAANWTAGNTGARMDYRIRSYMDVGGHTGTAFDYHGKIASMVVTTLKQGVAMPTEAESLLMITDPMKWLNDYKVGNTYRSSGNYNETAIFALGNTFSAWSTQVWLMGDGTNDSYPNIRNQVSVNEQIYTELEMLSMASNDIETVSIPGLS